eukprot:809104-Pelagomonas_calceolata.AAC.3
MSNGWVCARLKSACSHESTHTTHAHTGVLAGCQQHRRPLPQHAPREQLAGAAGPYVCVERVLPGLLCPCHPSLLPVHASTGLLSALPAIRGVFLLLCALTSLVGQCPLYSMGPYIRTLACKPALSKLAPHIQQVSMGSESTAHQRCLSWPPTSSKCPWRATARASTLMATHCPLSPARLTSESPARTASTPSTSSFTRWVWWCVVQSVSTVLAVDEGEATGESVQAAPRHALRKCPIRKGKGKVHIAVPAYEGSIAEECPIARQTLRTLSLRLQPSCQARISNITQPSRVHEGTHPHDPGAGSQGPPGLEFTEVNTR